MVAVFFAIVTFSNNQIKNNTKYEKITNDSNVCLVDSVRTISEM